MAASCPSCGRPVALARPQCAYCGAALPAAAVEEAARQAAEAAAPAPFLAAGTVPEGAPRSLLVLDLEEADARALAAALALSSFEASQRVRRGGWQLHRIAPAEEAARDLDRLVRAGLRVLAIPEAEVRAAARPVPVAGGSWAGDGLALRTQTGPLQPRADGLLLVVRGPITREYLAPARTRRVRTATLDQGYRFHLHRRDDPRPLELDPAAFDFGLPSLTESSMLLLSSWIDKAAAGVPVDDRFRREAAVLQPAAPETAGIAAALGGAGQRRKEDEAQVLDNLEQFRFYSAWRACALRRSAR
jgi:hypothetical protein